MKPRPPSSGAIWYSWTIDAYARILISIRPGAAIPTFATHVSKNPDALREDQLSFCILPGLRVLHLSVELADFDTLLLPPRYRDLRGEVATRLEKVRQLGLQCLTVMVSDASLALFGQRALAGL